MNRLAKLRESMGAAVRESMGGRNEAPKPALPAQDHRHTGLSRPREQVAEIPLERIAPDPDQPRKQFDLEALARLAEDLRTRGQLQPVRVRWDERLGVYVLLMGERRLRAAREAGLPSLVCVIHDGPLTPAEVLGLQLVENALREDLKPLEQARAFQALKESGGLSDHQLAADLHLDQTTVSRALALLRLGPAAASLVESGALAASTGAILARLEDPGEQAALAEEAAEHGLSRAEVERRIRESRARREAEAAAALAPPGPEPAGPGPGDDPDEESPGVAAPDHVEPPVRHRASPAREPGAPRTGVAEPAPAPVARTKGGAVRGAESRESDVGNRESGGMNPRLPTPDSRLPVPAPEGTAARGGEGPAAGERTPPPAGPDRPIVHVAHRDLDGLHGELVLAIGRSAGTAAEVEVRSADGGPTVVRALALALAEAERLCGLERPDIDLHPGVHYDPIRDHVPAGVAQCTRCHRRRPIECRPCPACLCPEFGCSPLEDPNARHQAEEDHGQDG